MKKKVLLAIGILFLLTGTALAVPDGIYKDIPPIDEPALVAEYALYVQTYETQSIVAVLLDNSGGFHNTEQRLYAFLGSDYMSGINEDEIGGADAHLVLSPFSGDNTAQVVFTAGGVTAAFSIYRWVESPDAASVLLNGIYKDQPLEGPPASFNLYFQTYRNVTPTSAIAIVTHNDGAAFFAHLDPDLDDGFAEFDLLKGEGHLSLTFVQTGTDVPAVPMGASPMEVTDKKGEFTFTLPGGEIVSGELYKHFQAPALEVIF